MGSPSHELGRKWDEKRHKVVLTRNFNMSVTEVTQTQWQRVMNHNPSAFYECGGDCPVETVSWNDCQEFIRRLNLLEKTDKYRLPTEAEWEYACRAGTSTAFASGKITAEGCDPDPNLDKIGWYCGNSGMKAPVHNITPHPVARKAPNGWGLYDMHGNVQEWCLDACKPRGVLRTGVVNNTYSKSSITAPLSRKGPNRIFRGGSWNTSTKYSRSANRSSFKPLTRRNSIGFRLVKEN